MSDLTVTQLLGEMQRLKTIARSDEGVQASPAGKSDFAGLFQDLLQQVNAVRSHSAEMATAFERGDANVDLVDVMISGQKSSLAFQSVLQVRNKLVSAYQDIMNMPI